MVYNIIAVTIIYTFERINMSKTKLTQEEAKAKDPPTGPYMIGIYSKGSIKTEYKCKCGNIFLTRPSAVWRKSSKSCGHCNNPNIGDKNGRLTIIKIHQLRGHGCTVECECDCSTQDTVFKGSGYWKGWSSRFKNTLSCGCLQREIVQKSSSKNNWTGTKDISGQYFSAIKANAKKRNILFNITKEYIQQLLEEQNYKCALTNLPIKTSRTHCRTCSTYSEQTASLDRINSLIGYIEGNVQWIHKDINNIKQDFPEEQLLEYCKLLLEHKKLKDSLL